MLNKVIQLQLHLGKILRRVISRNKLLASFVGVFFLLSSEVPLNDGELALFINWVVNLRILLDCTCKSECLCINIAL